MSAELNATISVKLMHDLFLPAVAVQEPLGGEPGCIWLPKCRLSTEAVNGQSPECEILLPQGNVVMAFKKADFERGTGIAIPFLYQSERKVLELTLTGSRERAGNFRLEKLPWEIKVENITAAMLLDQPAWLKQFLSVCAAEANTQLRFWEKKPDK